MSASRTSRCVQKAQTAETPSSASEIEFEGVDLGVHREC